MPDNVTTGSLTQDETRKRDKRILLKKAQLLWKLVTTTTGVADLAEPMKRAERDFDRLSKGQRLTIAVIASTFDRGCHEIDTQEGSSTQGSSTGGTVQATQAQAFETVTESVTPDEVIPPPHQDEGS
jgi:hypothetical protein